MRFYRKPNAQAIYFAFKYKKKVAYLKPSLLLFVLLTGVLCLLTDTNIACVRPKRSRPRGTIRMVETIDGEVSLLLPSSYVTFAANPPTQCAMAFLHSGRVIQSVDKVSVVITDTASSVFNFRIENSDRICRGFFIDTEFNACQGFLARVDRPIAEGQDVDVIFSLTLKPNATVEQLQLDLATALVGTDEANADGSLKGTHQHIEQLGDITIESIMTVPTLSKSGVIILTLLLMLSGIFFILCRPENRRA